MTPDLASRQFAPASTPEPRRSAVPRATALRTALLVGAFACAALASLAAAGQAQAAEPELATLLRGMAAIKGLLAFAVAAAVWWRVGRPVSNRVAATYLACTWVFFASTALIWLLAFIVAAAVLFHAAGFVVLVVALREGHVGRR